MRSLRVYFLVALIFLSGTIAYSDMLIRESGEIWDCRIQKISPYDILISSNQNYSLVKLNDIKGFSRDHENVLVVMENSQKVTGYYFGIQGKDIIVEVDGNLELFSSEKIKSVNPFSTDYLNMIEIGIKNGILLSGYDEINHRIAEISSGLPLAETAYSVGIYLDARVVLQRKLGLDFGFSIEYIPSLGTDLLNPLNNLLYGKLFVDSSRIVIPLGLSVAIIPTFHIGLSIHTSLNIATVYETFIDTSIPDVNISHLTIGLMPALEFKFRLKNSLNLGFLLGYETTATLKGLLMQCKTGIVF